MGPRGPKLLVISPTVLLRHSHPHLHPTPRVQAGTGWTETGQGSTAVPSSVAPTPREGPGHLGRPSCARLATALPLRGSVGRRQLGRGWPRERLACVIVPSGELTRGHVGKTLVPAALPARNAPPAPQSPPAWPRNGDSHAPCSHPLGAHPARPTKGLARAPRLPASAAAGPLPASPSFHCASVGDWGIWSHKVAPECPGTSMLPPPHRLACSELARNSHPFGTYYPRLPPPLRKHSPRDPHTQHKAKNSGQIKNNNKEPGQHLEAGNRTFMWEGCPRVTYVRRHMTVDPYSLVSLLRSTRSTHPLWLTG